MGGFAVVDVETTGLHPGYHHRVVEIAVIQLSADGREEARYSTVVNPERDMGPQDIHGISAADAQLAPLFADIAGDLVELMRGRVLVAHNALFDLTFIDAEFSRAGADLPRLWECTLDTMRLADYYLPGVARTLEGCCIAAGIELENAHHALGDAAATAELLRLYFDSDPDAEWWGASAAAAEHAAWPMLVPLRSQIAPRGVADPGGPRTIEMIRRFESKTQPPYHNDYFSLLDRVVADGKVTLTERRALADFTAALRLSSDDVVALNRSYLRAAVDAATEDQVLTQDERARLVQLCHLLEVSDEDAAAVLAIAERDADWFDPTVLFRAGDEVVFTGMSEVDKRLLSEVASGVGLSVHSGVRGTTRAVVAADTASASGKATRARQVGAPVISVEDFQTSLLRLRSS